MFYCLSFKKVILYLSLSAMVAHQIHLCDLPLLMEPTTVVTHPDMATTTYNEIDTSIRILVAIN